MPIQIVGESIVSPDEDLFLKLRELRGKTKNERDQHPIGSPEYHRLDTIQNCAEDHCECSLVWNLHRNQHRRQECEADVYGLKHFKCRASKEEHFGRFSHPIVSTMLTSGARLLLAMAEAWLCQHGGYYAFCDTDSMAVSPFHWKKLQQFFEPLNPIPGEPFLKLEDENKNERGNPRQLWFYGISAKRYVLYYLDERGDPVPVKWSSHGLGHLLHDKANWEKELWTNILRYAHGIISKEQLLEHYANEHAISKLALTKPSLLRRVNALNKGKPLVKQIKPYSFALVGSPTMKSASGKPVVPLTPFTREYGLAPYQRFIDANTGKPYEENTELYWKTLNTTVEEYIDHPESKFENGQHCGTMRRRHLRVGSIHYIGKEANELEETRDSRHRRGNVRGIS